MCVEILFNIISSVIYHSLGDSPSVTNVLSWFLTDDFFKIGAAKQINVPSNDLLVKHAYTKCRMETGWIQQKNK
jgi:hypothetical protein